MCLGGSSLMSKPLPHLSWRWSLFSWPSERMRTGAKHFRQALTDDWHGTRYCFYGLVLLLVTTLTVIAFYLNHPQVEDNPDTITYLLAAQNIVEHGNFVDPRRTPGYPLFLVVIYILADKNAFLAASLTQGALFVLATLEVYLITALLFRRAWLALIVGLLVGTNVFLLGYIKPVIIEGFSLWLITTLALVVVIFAHTFKVRDFWLVVVVLFALFMTRPEWIYLPIPLFAYLLMLAARRGKFRRLLVHSLVAVLLMYSILGLYVYTNATENSYLGVTFIQNVNLLGKVMQYHMQNEAPARYATATQKINTILAQNPQASPFDVARQYPEFTTDNWKLSGDYATSIVEGHPAEFLIHTVYVFFISSDAIYAYFVHAEGHFATPLSMLQITSVTVDRTLRFFPLFMLIWGGLLCWRRTRKLRLVETMGALVLLALYEQWMISIGAYSDYMRFQEPFNPLRIIVIWGSFLMGCVLCESLVLGGSLLQRAASFWRGLRWGLIVLVAGGLVANMAVAWFTEGKTGLTHPHTWLVGQVFLAHYVWNLGILILLTVLILLIYRASRRSPAANLPTTPPEPLAAPSDGCMSEGRLPNTEEMLYLEIRKMLLKASRLLRAKQAIHDDWQGMRVLSYSLVVLLASSVVTAAFYLNHLHWEWNDDTPGYLASTQNILQHGNFVSALRVPGFPAFMALIFLLVGKQSLFAVSLVQAVLFVMVALEVYIMVWLLFRRSWLALIAGLLVGTNTYLLSFTKPVTVEGISIWLVTTLACATVLFVQTVKVRDFWLVAILTLVLFMTRPEWMYVPLPLFVYLLFLAARRGKLRRLLPHGIAAVVLLYAVLGLYIYANATQNGYLGVSYIQNINELGKVMQYQMQNDAPLQYASLTEKINAFLAQHPDGTPYNLWSSTAPEVSYNDWALSGEYGGTVIQHHLLEFSLKTIPVIFTSSDELYAFSPIDHQGHFALPLLVIQVVSAGVQRTYRLFPFFALGWLFFLFWGRTRRQRSVEIMGAVLLLASYDLVLTSVGAYDDYMRFHIPFDPLVTIAIWGSILMGLALCEPYVLRGHVRSNLLRLWQVIGWVWGTLVGVLLLVCIGWTVLATGASGLAHPNNWPIVTAARGHPLYILGVLAVPVFLTFLAYRASRFSTAQEQMKPLIPSSSSTG